MTRLHVRLTPGASADRIDGWGVDPDGRPVLLARVRARPVEGEANVALERLLADRLGVPKRAVEVARGGKSRLKAVEIDGLDECGRGSRPDRTAKPFDPCEPSRLYGVGCTTPRAGGWRKA